jgi:hypothetical protein
MRLRNTDKQKLMPTFSDKSNYRLHTFETPTHYVRQNIIIHFTKVIRTVRVEVAKNSASINTVNAQYNV